MKEITRIHIAKIPYDIEIAAKKTLESYMKSLEAYSDDKEIINDIEIRITEILVERGVQKDGVISVDDVSALKNQLGEPREFMGEGDMAVGAEEAEIDDNASRKLYRDIDHRVIGGVLAGIAAFFKVNPVWVRLIFIIVALASFGTALLVYIVLWIAVPPARTATDKLQMVGRPVTVNSIRELNENEAGKPATNTSARRVVTLLLGISCVIGAVMAAVGTIALVLAPTLSGREHFMGIISNSGLLLAAYILALVSGLLLVVVFILGAYASFAQKMTRRVLVSICVVIILGLVSFGTAIGLSHFGGSQISRAIKENTRETPLALPADAKTATILAVDVDHIKVKYVVSKSAPTAVLRAVAKDNSAQPKVAISLEGGTLKIESNEKQSVCMPMWGCRVGAPTIVVHGPELAHITTSEGSSVEYAAESQNELAVDAGKDSDVTIISGVIDTLRVVAGDNASVFADEVTISDVSVESNNASDIQFGNVRNLELTDKEACPAGSTTRIDVWNVSSKTIEVNGVRQSAEKLELACMELDIKGDERR